MEQKQYLIDSNVVIDYLGNRLPAAGMQFMNAVMDAVPLVSVITKIEVLGFSTLDEHYEILVNFMNDAIILDLSETVVRKPSICVKSIEPNCLTQSSKQLL